MLFVRWSKITAGEPKMNRSGRRIDLGFFVWTEYDVSHEKITRDSISLLADVFETLGQTASMNTKFLELGCCKLSKSLSTNGKQSQIRSRVRVILVVDNYIIY